MTAEASRVEIRLDADGRLIAAVTGAVGYLASTAGLSEPALSNLRSATAGALREAFSRAEGPLLLTVLILRFPDRIEIEVAQVGSSGPAVGLHTLAGAGGSAAEQARNPFLSGGVDRVQFETQGMTALTRLTKYLPPPAA